MNYDPTSAANLVSESNGLGPDASAYHKQFEGAERVTLRELADRGGRVTRVRVLAERVPGHGILADLSYVHGRIGDEPVHIILSGGVFLVPLRHGGLQKALVAWAKEEGVYAKGLGLLDRGNWSILY